MLEKVVNILGKYISPNSTRYRSSYNEDEARTPSRMAFVPLRLVEIGQEISAEEIEKYRQENR